MKAIQVTQEIIDNNPHITFTEPIHLFRVIPSRFNGWLGGFNLRSDLHEVEGLYPVVTPTYDKSTHKLGELDKVEGSNEFTYKLIELTQEELDANAAKEQQRLIQEQVDLQILREERGKDEFRLMTAALRAQVGSGLALDQYNAIEVLLEPLGDTINQGKWTKCYMMLVKLGAENVGADLYNQLEAKLRAGIIELYDEHDYPFEV
ncbi:hypothetical protein [Formosa sp. S-31]|uniref:hypothetical protein n=1 Tax=Formosa sp. S-31 TaxID=2790949 RepID=UPI003EBB1B11